MRLEDTRRWQWMLIAPIVGLLIGYVRYLYDDGVGHIDHSFNAPKVWEEEAVKMVAGPDGKPLHPAFYDLRVVKSKVKGKSGSVEDKYVIVGLWIDLKRLNLRGKTNDAGQFTYTPMRAIFDADLPYKPGQVKIKDPSKLPPPTWLDRLAKVAEALRLKDEDPKDSVLDYLKRLSAQNPDVKFRYEWWRQPRVSMATWAVGCFIVIGVIWPTVINLIAFGSVFRPRREKGTDLSKVRGTPSDSGHKPKVTAADLEELKRLEEEMERKLKEGASERRIGVGPTDQLAEAPIKPLTGAETVAAPAAEPQRPRKTFGVDGDDFYPTEVHGVRKDDD